MNAILPIAIWAAIGLAVLSLLGMAVSGLRSLGYGKVKPLSIAIVAIPGVIILVLGFTMETWAQAGIFTLVIMFGLTVLAMLITGARKVFTGV